MNRRGNVVLSILLGVLIASMLGFTTDEIIRNVYDSSNTALRVNLVSGGSSGTVTGTGTAGLMPIWSTTSALGDSSCLPVPVTNDTVTGTTVNKLAKVKTSNGSAIITGAAETAGILGIVTGGAGLSGSAQVCMLGSASCVFDNATTNGHFVGVSSSVAGDCTDLGTNDYTTIAAGTTVLGTVTVTAAAGTRAMLLGTPDVQGQSGGGGNKNPAGVAGNLQTRGAGNQFAVFAATDDTVPIGNGTIHVATAINNCIDTGGNHLNYTTATNAFSCGTSSGTPSLAFPLTVSGTTTSGGIPYFSSTTALTSSGLLTANAVMIGGGAGATPTTPTIFTYDSTQPGYLVASGTLGTNKSAFHITGTAPAAGDGNGALYLDTTTSGSTAGSAQGGFLSLLEAGYTGNGYTWSGYFYNAVAGTGTDYQWNNGSTQPQLNTGVFITELGADAGNNVGQYITANGSTGQDTALALRTAAAESGEHYGILAQTVGSTQATNWKNVGFYFSQVASTAPFVTGVNVSVGGIIDSNGNDEMRFYNNKVLQATIAQDGAFSTKGKITSSATADLGWSIVAATNQACNTTCTSACVMGTDAVTGGFLACTDATADVCLCAGSS